MAATNHIVFKVFMQYENQKSCVRICYAIQVCTIFTENGNEKQQLFARNFLITHTFEWSQELMLMDLLHKVNDQVWFPQLFQKVSVQGGPVLPPGKAGACFKDAVVRAGEKSRVSPACKECHGQLKFILHIIHYHTHTNNGFCFSQTQGHNFPIYDECQTQ